MRTTTEYTRILDALTERQRWICEVADTVAIVAMSVCIGIVIGIVF